MRKNPNNNNFTNVFTVLVVWHNLLWPPATHTPFWVCCSVKYGTSTLYSLFPTREYVQPHGFCHTKYTCVGDGSHHVCSMLYTPIINIYLQRKYLSPILLEEDALRQEKLKNTMIDYDHEICTLFSAFSCSLTLLIPFLFLYLYMKRMLCLLEWLVAEIFHAQFPGVKLRIFCIHYFLMPRTRNAAQPNACRRPYVFDWEKVIFALSQAVFIRAWSESHSLFLEGCCCIFADFGISLRRRCSKASILVPALYAPREHTELSDWWNISL